MILVVDDYAAVRNSVLRLLASHGYAATAVAGGRQALNVLRSCAPGLIILDLNMPDVDGLGVLRAVRADARLATVPVVMLSACPGDDAPGEIADLGVQDWIVKASEEWVERLLEAAQRYSRDGSGEAVCAACGCGLGATPERCAGCGASPGAAGAAAAD